MPTQAKRKTAPARANGAGDKQPMLRRWLRRGLETHISLPLFALLLLAAIWMATAHFVRIERAAEVAAMLRAQAARLLASPTDAEDRDVAQV